MTAKGAIINVNALRKSALVLRALNHPVRQNIIKLIHSNQPIQEQGIYRKLEISQSLVSYQLTILKKEHFVRLEEKDKKVFYYINYERFSQVDKLSKDALK
jgi:DNA-binding transcriptional ArsR family regulator